MVGQTPVLPGHGTNAPGRVPAPRPRNRAVCSALGMDFAGGDEHLELVVVLHQTGKGYRAPGLSWNSIGALRLIWADNPTHNALLTHDG